jgi:hypothetical protein
MDRSYGMATEELRRSSDEAGELEAQARAFSDVGRSLTAALEHARVQASEIIGRAQDHSDQVVRSTDHRLAEALRQATTAERRAAASREQLAGLEDLSEQALARLAQIGAHAGEIAQLICTAERWRAPVEPLPARSYTERVTVASPSGRTEALTMPDDDPLAALALLRDEVNASR